MEPNMKRSLLAAATVAAAVALATTIPAPAMAADHKGANRSCTGTWTWSGVTSSASTVHQHNTGGSWVKGNRDAGTTSMRGLYSPGAALLQADTSGTFSSWAFGCQ